MEQIKVLRAEMVEMLARIIGHVSFLIGYWFGSLRQLGQFFAAIVDSAVEGYGYSAVRVS